MPRPHHFKNFTICPEDAPLLSRMTETQRYVLTTKDSAALQMAHMRCAKTTVKTRRHRARKVLTLLREEAARAIDNEPADTPAAGDVDN